MSRTARAFKTTLVVTAFGYASQGLSIVAIPLFLSTVGIDSYGLMVTVMAFTGYLNFADAGLSWGSMILIAQAHGRGGKAEIAHIVRHAAVLAAASGLVVALAVAVVLTSASFGWRLPMFAHHPEADRLVLIAGAQLIVTLQFGIVYNVFQGLQQGYWTGVYQGASRLLGLLCAMAAAWTTHSVAAVMLVQLAMAVLCGIAAMVHGWRLNPWAFQRGPWFDRAQYHSQIRIGAKSFLLQIGRTLSGTAPTLGISSILGPAFVPFYTVPTTLLSLFFTPINSWNSSMQSAYGEAWTAGDLDWIRTAFRRSIARALLVGSLGVALFVAEGDTFIRLWTHARLSLSAPMAASICAIVVSGALIAAGEYLLTGLNRHKTAAVAELANGLIALALVPLSVHWFGLGAVGMGVVAAALASSAWVLRREIAARIGNQCFPSPWFLLRLAATGAAAAWVAWLFVGSLGPQILWPTLLHLALGGAAGCGVFALLAAALRLVDSEEAAAVKHRMRRMFAVISP